MLTQDAYDCRVTVPARVCAMAGERIVAISAGTFEIVLDREEARRLVAFARLSSGGQMALRDGDAAVGGDGAVMLTSRRKTARIDADSPFWSALAGLLDRAEESE